ncbi:hypothetical protein IHN32_00225 [Deinococcus sp. 14RED07]|uniref:hypothetical protein n=1 Tax=unclassified Deinococcus TaxID=2623546 RepID=UPI001E63053B|nr:MULTISPECIES: hypothetical protein [unclassified Deinococcus]MCD0159888.1 hypothetical protein [Deinococcus sp. 6YEL10]MCD0164125.1 hypothetical protein [Deinococcus sp. 12RED42]MCD0174383.1 hypothetical protein [Deinococcus sp. 14RED07]
MIFLQSFWRRRRVPPVTGLNFGTQNGTPDFTLRIQNSLKYTQSDKGEAAVFFAQEGGTGLKARILIKPAGTTSYGDPTFTFNQAASSTSIIRDGGCSSLLLITVEI